MQWLSLLPELGGQRVISLVEHLLLELSQLQNFLRVISESLLDHFLLDLLDLVSPLILAQGVHQRLKSEYLLTLWLLLYQDGGLALHLFGVLGLLLRTFAQSNLDLV